MSYLPISGVVYFETATLPLKVASDPVSITLGMMGATTMDYALAFQVSPGPQGFWMKNCKIPLDIIYCKLGDDHSTIDRIHHLCPPCKTTVCPLYRGYGDFVLEVPGGFCKRNGVAEGQKVFFYTRK